MKRKEEYLQVASSPYKRNSQDSIVSKLTNSPVPVAITSNQRRLFRLQLSVIIVASVAIILIICIHNSYML